ncbi:MAG: YgaP family membrane protein [Bacteroidales bacterium]
MNPLDRMIRLLAGLVCWLLIFMGYAKGISLVILLVLSIPLLVTSFWGYCGLYALIRKKDNSKIDESKKNIIHQSICFKNFPDYTSLTFSIQISTIKLNSQKFSLL